MITLSAADLEQVYTVPKVLLNEYRDMFLLFTEQCKPGHCNYNAKVHRHDVIEIAMDDQQMKDWMEDETVLRFIATATLMSCKVCIPGTYEVIPRLGTSVYAKHMEIDEKTDGIYILPHFLAVRNVNISANQPASSVRSFS